MESAKHNRRSVSATIKMTSDDMALFKEAGIKHFRGALMSQSTLILQLARIGAECIQAGKAELLKHK